MAKTLSVEFDTSDGTVGRSMRKLLEVGCTNVRAAFRGGGGDDGYIAVMCDFPESKLEDVKKVFKRWGYNTFDIEGTSLFPSSSH